MTQRLLHEGVCPARRLFRCQTGTQPPGQGTGQNASRAMAGPGCDMRCLMDGSPAIPRHEEIPVHGPAQMTGLCIHRRSSRPGEQDAGRRLQLGLGGHRPAGQGRQLRSIGSHHPGQG